MDECGCLLNENYNIYAYSCFIIIAHLKISSFSSSPSSEVVVLVVNNKLDKYVLGNIL